MNTFRAQAEEQENNLKAQEAEVAAKKQELSDLRSEELRMEQQLQSTTEKLEKLVATLQDTQLQISQVKGKKSSVIGSYRKEVTVSCFP